MGQGCSPECRGRTEEQKNRLSDQQRESQKQNKKLINRLSKEESFKIKARPFFFSQTHVVTYSPPGPFLGISNGNPITSVISREVEIKPIIPCYRKGGRVRHIKVQRSWDNRTNSSDPWLATFCVFSCDCKTDPWLIACMKGKLVQWPRWRFLYLL